MGWGWGSRGIGCASLLLWRWFCRCLDGGFVSDRCALVRVEYSALCVAHEKRRMVNTRLTRRTIINYSPLPRDFQPLIAFLAAKEFLHLPLDSLLHFLGQYDIIPITLLYLLPQLMVLGPLPVVEDENLFVECMPIRACR